MDHQNLYKVSRITKNIRLKNYQSICQVKRTQAFQNTRLINISPEINNENEVVGNNNQEKQNIKLMKIQKQEAYCAKYLAWKQEKENRKTETKTQKKPFCAATNRGLNSFAPENYKFRPKGILSVPKKTENKIINNFVLTPVKKRIITNNNNMIKPPIRPTLQKNPPFAKINKLQPQPIKKNTIKPNLLKPQPIILKKKIEKKMLVVDEKPSKFIEQTPNENPEHPFKSIFTSTQRKDSLNTNLKISDELNDSIISPIEFLENNNDNKLLIDLNKTNNSWCPSPIKTQTSTVKFNYLSPYVSTSRGKVSAKKEKVKRDSIYLLENTSPDDDVIIRRMKEAVKRFNKLLNDETERLENLCNVWNKYINDNIDMLNDNGGIDMINATLGQTKLLLTKKFKQFVDLIEKCTNYVMKNKNIDNGENGELPIYPEDLEGFWSMLNIQIEDIDKRFNNINKWKENDWNDPDDNKQLKVKKINPLSLMVGKKSKKNNVQPSSQIKDYIRKLLIEQRKNKINSTQKEDVVVVRKRRSSINNQNKQNTPLRRSSRRISKISTLNEDKNNLEFTPIRKSARKSRPATPGFMVLLPKKDDIENITPRRNTRSEWRCVNLLKSDKKSHDTMTRQVLQSPPRKSILKTPGTSKKNCNVIFNEQLAFKSPEQFKLRKSSEELLTRNLSETPTSCGTPINFSAEKRKGKRSLTLRSRRLLVDPNAKIEIPHER